MTDLGFVCLQQHHNWPLEKPSLDDDEHGWVGKEKQQHLRQLITINPRNILELGCWIGQSTRFFLENYQKAHVVSIDTFKGSPEHHKPNRKDADVLQPLLPKLYQQFVVNCWDYQQRLVPLQGTTTQQIEEVRKAGFVPDLVFVDASHEYEDVLLDLQQCYQFAPEALYVGDDWRWINSRTNTKTVQLAVEEFCRQHKDLTLKTSDSIWALKGEHHERKRTA